MTDDEARAEVERLIADEIAKLVGLPLDDAEAQVNALAERLVQQTREFYGGSLVVSNDGETLRFRTTVDAEWGVGRTAGELRALGMEVGEAIPGDAVMVIVDGEIAWLRESRPVL